MKQEARKRGTARAKAPSGVGEAPAVVSRVSSESARAATGRGWDEWVVALDAAGAGTWNHKEIVAHLEREHGEVTSSWWRQSITNIYEKARGTRVTGETADSGFQVGVQRSVPVSIAAVWKLIAEQPELWLGKGATVQLEKGARYEVRGKGGASGEIRVVKPRERLRMTWQPKGWSAPATLQLTLSRSAAGKTAIHVHLEKLPDAEAREAMRERWREALDRIASATQTS